MRSSLTPAFTRKLLVAALFLPALPGAETLDPVETEATPPSRYNQTIQLLRREPQEEQRNFATIAIQSLVEIYYAEADLALSEAMSTQAAQAKGQARRAWAFSVERYTDQLLSVDQLLAAGAEVKLVPGIAGEAAMVVAEGERVMLSHPREGQQAVYEQQVLNEYCRHASCSELVAVAPTAAALPPTPAAVDIEWAFTTAGMSCRYRGISLQFSPKADGQRSRSLCEQIYAELAAFEEELRWQVWRGVTVEWSRLAIQRRIGETGHSVRLNTAGDTLLLRLPVLAANQPLFSATQEWLQTTVAGDEVAALALQAAEYGLEQ